MALWVFSIKIVTLNIFLYQGSKSRQKSCRAIVHESCATKIVHELGFDPNQIRLFVLKYANFTNLDHLESILINFSAFLEKNYHFTSKNAPKIVDPAKKSCTTKSCTTEILSWKSCESCTTSCTISVVISNPGIECNFKGQLQCVFIESTVVTVELSQLNIYGNENGHQMVRQGHLRT